MYAVADDKFKRNDHKIAGQQEYLQHSTPLRLHVHFKDIK